LRPCVWLRRIALAIDLLEGRQGVRWRSSMMSSEIYFRPVPMVSFWTLPVSACRMCSTRKTSPPR